MYFGIISSAVLHLLILLIIYFGLPYFSKKLPTETAISIEILPVKDISNVANKKAQQKDQKNESKTIVKAANDSDPKTTPKEMKPKPEPINQPKPKEETKPEVTKETIKTTPTPTKPKEIEKDKKQQDTKKVNPPIEKPKKNEQKTKAQTTELDSLLKTLDTPSDKKTEKAKENKQNSSDNNQNSKSNKEFDNTQPLSLSEEAAIRSQIYKCWRIPAGAKDIGKMSVVLRITLAQDGTVNTVKIIEENKPSKGDIAIFRAFADSAVRAVQMCSPLQNLPIEKYNLWQEIELNFDPREMLD